MKERSRRNSLRLDGWDYRNAGYYFVTFCTHKRVCLFETDGVKTYLTETWEQIPTWKNMDAIVLDEFVVMPNHLHAILMIAETPEGLVDDFIERNEKTRPGSISSVIAAFKSTTSRQMRRRFSLLGEGQLVWQRGYYDRIIRNESELNAIRQYIQMNPARWQDDRDNLAILTAKMCYHVS